jgi:predicted RNA-binding Zn-ribbon protein involved in translation (DUF1610 family)
VPFPVRVQETQPTSHPFRPRCRFADVRWAPVMVDVLQIAFEEQVRARSIVSGLGPCRIVLSRARTELGSFSVSHDGRDMEIRISRHIPDAEQVRETARHELAHQAAWQRYHYVGHGALWQTFANYLGCEPKACSTVRLEGAIRPKYVVVCNACGWSITRERRSKLVTRPWHFACPNCGGSLVVAAMPKEPVSGRPTHDLPPPEAALGTPDAR